MVRYRKYKKRYGGTRSIKMKFQSFMDINTSANSMQIITISAGGPEVLKRLAPQFAAYKYYRLGSISAKLVPASTLPVDPTGLSYEAGEPGVDPRDQLTPGLMRITNGEDIFEDISGLSDDQQHAIYNNMLLDPRWFKWMLQSGVKRYATPRYWQIGQLHQDKWPGAILNMPNITVTESGTTVNGTAIDASKHVYGSGVQHSVGPGSSPYGFFQTGHSGKLGWLPTDSLEPIISPGQSVPAQYPLLASPPEVEVMKIILPKAYKTEYYYRLFITETVYFREPIVNFGIAVSGLEYRPLDVFHTPGWPAPKTPGQGTISADWPENSTTGGNYGDD